MFRLLLALMILASSALAQRVLHVSTIPSNADIYLDEISPDHTSNPDYVSPAFIEVDEDQAIEGTILLSLFHRTFADTTIRVTLSDRDTSYLIVSGRPLIEEALIEAQDSELSKRSRKNFGRKLMIASIIPFAVSAIAGAYTYYEIEKANDCKSSLKNSAISESSHFHDTQKDFKDHRQKAKHAKYATLTGLGLGSALLTIGFILSF